MADEKLHAPVLAAAVTSDTASIGWSRVEGADRYELELRTNGNVSATFATVANETAFPSSSLPTVPTIARVRAVAGDAAGTWSAPVRLEQREAVTPTTDTGLLPAPLLQVVYQAGNVVLNFSAVAGATGYSAQLLTQGGQVAASGTTTDLTISFSATQYNLEVGTTYLARAAGTANGSTGQWSTPQPVTITNLATPVATTYFQGGTLYGNVQTAVSGAVFYAFRATIGTDVVGEAFVAASALPAAFSATFADGAAVNVTVQAVDGNILSAWSDAAPITIAILTPPVLQLTFSDPDIVATWNQVSGLTQYEFQLWTAGSTPTMVSQQTITQAPWTAQVSAGITEDQFYLGKLASQQGLNTSVWSTAEVQASMLDPLLVTLYDNFNTAWGGGATLPINATTLGTPGAAIVTLMQNSLGVSQIVVNQNITLTQDPALDTVTVTGLSQDPLLGITAAPITAVFSVSNGAIVANITITTTSGWNLGTTFTPLQNTMPASLTWSGTPAFILSSIGAPATATYGAIVPGLNLYGNLSLTGQAAGLTTLLTGVSNPLTVTGPVSTSSTAFALTLSASVPSVTFSSLPGLGTLSFAPATFSINASSTASGRPTFGLWVGATVTAGGVIMPLVVQLPIGAGNFVIMMQPGVSVPVPNLSTFFGFVSGVSIADALPSAVTAQTGLQVQQFRIALTPDLQNFYSLQLAIGSTTGAQNPLWSPLPGILDMTTLSLGIEVALNSSNQLAVSGWIEGTVVFGGALQLGASILLPVGTGNWTFTAATATSLASLDMFNNLTGGASFAGTLPGGLGSLPQFTLGSLTLIVDPTGPTLTTITFELYSNAQWHIIGDQIVVDTISCSLTMTNPTVSSRQLTGQISCALILGSVRVSTMIERVSSTADWTFTASADEIPLPSLGDLANFVGGEGAAALLPASLATNSFALRDTSVTLNLTQQTLQTIGFTLVSEDDWTIFPGGVLGASDVSAGLTLDWTSGTLVTSGMMGGTVYVAGASFAITATYINAIWTIDAEMVIPDPNDVGDLDFSGALTQFGISSQFLIPTNVGLPTLMLTSGSLHLVPATGEMSVSATSALVWPITFGTGTNPMQVATLGGTINKLAGGAGWNASITGTLTYAGIYGAVTVALGSAGTDTVITASVGNIPPSGIPTLADDLGEASDGSNAWTTIPFPSDFPSLGLAQATLYLNLTQNTFVITGSSSVFGSAAFLVQKMGNGWQSALGVNLSSNGQPWTFSEISAGLAAAGTFFNIDQASAALAISTIDEQSLAAITAVVPELANALPDTVKRGANFYGVLHFSGSVVSNVPRILNTDPGTTVTIYALVAEQSADSFFRVTLDQYTLAGVVQFENVYMQWQPATSPSLLLHGEVTLIVDSSSYTFIGDMQIYAASAQFRIQQSPQTIINPLGMTGITISNLGILIDYQFPDSATTTLAIQLTGTTVIGSVLNLTALLYLVDGTPMLTAITVTDFDIVNLFAQCIGVSWPSTLVPLLITSGSVYYSADTTALVLNGVTYSPGFNVAAHLLIIGVAATLTIAVVPDEGVTATGSLDNPIDWGFIIFSGSNQQVGPSASLATYPNTTFTLTAGFTIFDFYVGVVTFSIAKEGEEDVATVTFTRDVGAPFGTITITVKWSESRGYYFEDFPLDFPANFEIPDITSQSGACIGKVILQSLPIDTNYNFDSDYTITDGSLVITFQGYFELTAMNEQVLRIDLQKLTVTIPAPTGGDDPFEWSDIPYWIAKTIADNAYSIIKQVLDDPASMAKLLAIEGVKYAASALVDALVCEGWEAGEAAAFVEGAASAFATEVIVDGVAIVVGGIGVAIGVGGIITVGGGSGGSNPPPTPSRPDGLTMNYTNDQLNMSWNSATNAETYAWRLQTSGGSTVAQQSNTSGRSATVGVSQLTWGNSYTLTVLGMNDGVTGPSASTSYTIPTPLSVAQAQQSSGTALQASGAAIRQVFPSVDAVTMGNAIVSAYSASDPATYATPVATALRNGGYDQSTTDGALPQIFPGITQAELAAAIQAAYSLDSSQLAAYLAQHGASPQDAAQILNGVFALSATDMVSLLMANYIGISAATLVSALAVAPYTMDVNAAAVNVDIPTTAANMATYLVASYPSTTATPTAVAIVLQGVYASSITPLTMVQALQAGFTSPALTPNQAAQALVAAFTTPTPITATAAASAIAGAFGYPSSINVAAIAGALVVAFTTPTPINETQLAQALAALSPQPSASDVATAITGAMLSTTPSNVAIALVAAYTSPAITAVQTGQALVAAFTTPYPITANGVAIALVAAFTTPTPITPSDLAAALLQIITGISQSSVATALVAAYTAAPAITMSQVADALISAFGQAATVTSVAIALATAFPSGTPSDAAVALTGAFASSSPTPQTIAVALVAAFTQPTPITPNGTLVALQAAFTSLTPTQAAQSLVAAFTTPAPITATAVVQQLLAVTFSPAITPNAVAIALVAAFTQPAAITPAEVTAAMINGYGVAPLTASDIAIALVAAFTATPAITANQVAQTLQAAPFASPLTVPQNAVAVFAAFPALSAAELTAAMFAAYTNPLPQPLDIANALVAAMVQPPVTATTIAQILVANYTTPTPITATAVAAAIVMAMTNPPVANAAVITALQTAFTNPAITLSQAAQALQQAYASSQPLTLSAIATALFTGWAPAPSMNDVAVALMAAVPATTAAELAQALVTAVPTASANDVASALFTAMTSPAVTATQIAAALVAVFTTPTPITQSAVAQALVFANAQYDAVTVGQAIVAAFGESAVFASVAIALAAASFALGVVGSAINTIFTLTPANDAIGLVVAFPAASPSDVLQALIDVYTITTVTPTVGAQALYGAFITPARITPSANAIALVTVYTTPAPITQLEVTQALIVAYAPKPLLPADAAIALVAAFTNPAVTASQVSQTLVAAFTSPQAITPAQVAVGLVAAFTQPTPISTNDTIVALKAGFPSLTASDAAVALVAAFTQPTPISASDVAVALVAQFTLDFVACVQALQAAFGTSLLAPYAAQALVAAYTSPAITPQQVVRTLQSTYPSLTATIAAISLTVAFINPAITSDTVAATLVATFTNISASDVAIALVGAFAQPPITSNQVSTSLQSAFPTISLSDVAIALVASFTSPATITPSAVAITLQQTFPAATATMSNVASALVAAFLNISAGSVATALYAAFTGATASQVAAALVASMSASALVVAQALVEAQPTISPADVMTALLASVTTDLSVVASALAGAFPAQTASQIAAVLVAGAPSGTTVNQIATALVAAYAYTAATMSQLLTALVAGYASSPVPFDAGIASVALTTSLSLTDVNAAALASTVGTQFSLTRVPNDVAALSVCMLMSNISLSAASAALAAFYGSNWNGNAYSLLLSVYASPEWQIAITSKTQGLTTAQTAQQIITQNPSLSPVNMTTTLASTYFYTYAVDISIQQVGQGMKAAIYPLSAASSAMSIFYAPDWGGPQYQILLQVYSQP